MLHYSNHTFGRVDQILERIIFLEPDLSDLFQRLAKNLYVIIKVRGGSHQELDSGFSLGFVGL